VTDEPSKTRTERKPLSKRLRFEVFKRDGFVCQYCGAHPPEAILECDHIVPVVSGGLNEMTNLVTACEPCNRGKGAVGLSEIPESLSRRAEIVAEREEQIAGYESVMRQKRKRLDDDADEVLAIFCNAFQRDGIPMKDFSSIRTFVERLGAHEVIEAASAATRKFSWSYSRMFPYFCGICWNKIRRQETVRS
jgi:hypothetical protein